MRIWLTVAALAAGLPEFAGAQGTRLPPDAQIEHAVRSVWMKAGNDRPLCVAPALPHADQQGVQELQQVFAPGQWVIRVIPSRSNSQEFARLDYFAGAGLLERRDTFVNIGPIETRPAIEFRPTLKGWSQSMYGGPSPIQPCFYYGRAQLLKVLDYTETERDAEGFSKLSISFLVGADELVDWARTPEASALFPGIRSRLQGQQGAFTFYRTPEGKLKSGRDIREPIDDAAPLETVTYPDAEDAREGIARVQRAPVPETGLALPEPCLPLLPKAAKPIWNVSNTGATGRIVVKISPNRESDLLLYARLTRLQAAGLLSFKPNPAAPDEILVRPAEAILPLLVRHGGCLPLGEVRTELVGLLPDTVPGERRRFKARYLVQKPVPWIRRVKEQRLLPDLVAVLRDGQPFEGTILKMPYGWSAAYVEDRRPVPALATLSSVGISPNWRHTTERGIRRTSILDHDVHVINAHSGSRDQKESEIDPHPVGHIDVVAKEISRPMVIIVVGYEPIEWRFRVQKGVRLDAVLAVGYYEQKVIGVAPAIPVVTAYAPDGVRNNDPKMTRVYAPDRSELLSKLGIRPTTAQTADGSKPVEVGSYVRQKQ